MFSMSKSNPFASVQPFRDDPAPPDNEQGFHDGASSMTREATVAPATVTTQSWGSDGERSLFVGRTHSNLQHCAARCSA